MIKNKTKEQIIHELHKAQQFINELETKVNQLQSELYLSNSNQKYKFLVENSRNLSEPRLIEDIFQKRSYQQEQLLSAVRYLSQSLDEKEVFARIETETKDLVKADFCSIQLLDKDEHPSKIITPNGLKNRPNCFVISRPLQYYIINTILTERKGMIFNFLNSQSDEYKPNHIISENTIHCLAVPIISNANGKGVIYAMRSGKIFGEEELAIAEVFAAFAGIAIKNVQTHSELKESIKKRKVTEKARRLEHQQLLAIFNSIEESIYVADIRTYKIIFVNEYLKKLLKCDPVGKICYQVFQGQNSPCGFCTNSILEKEQKAYQWEYFNPSVNKYFILYDRLIKWPDGRDVRFELALDISNRKEIEEQLKNERDLLHTLLSIFPDMIYFKDSNLCFTRINKALAETIGLDDPNDAIGKTDNQFFAPEYAQSTLKDEKLIVRTKKPLINKVENMIRKDGVQRWVSTTKVPILDSHGHVHGIIGISRDFTELKRAEEEREKLLIELQKALAKVNTLSGLVPICSKCKKIRDDKGYWSQVEDYIHAHSGTEFSHSLCPECTKILYPDFHNRQRNGHHHGLKMPKRLGHKTESEIVN